MINWSNAHYFNCHEVGNEKCPWCWFQTPPEKCHLTENCTGLIHSDHECDSYSEEEQYENTCVTYLECDVCHKSY
jgi:hypothetical protein